MKLEKMVRIIASHSEVYGATSPISRGSTERLLIEAMNRGTEAREVESIKRLARQGKPLLID